VVDADTLLSLGLLGFCRHLAAAASRNQGQGDALRAAHKALGRRLHTAAGQTAAAPLREELRHLIDGLETALTSEPE
jgi:hypothetical protein